ncbi:MAG: hypothetical protein ACK5MT_00790 [Actinomycetales bacterium]
MRHALAPATSLGLVAVLGLTGYLGDVAVLGVLLVFVVGLSSGWPVLLGLPTPRGSTTVLALCGAIAVVVVYGTYGGPHPPLQWLAPVVACSIVVTFMHQLLRRDMRPRLVESVAGVVTGVVVVESGTAWLPALSLLATSSLIGLISVAVTSLIIVLPVRRPLVAVLAPLASLVCGAVVVVLGGGGVGPELAVALAVSTLLCALDGLFRRLPSANSRQAAVAVAISGLSVSGLVVLMLGAALT